MMKSSYSSTAAHVSSGHFFETFGCRDISKEMEDDFQDWMFNEGLVGDDKESVGQIVEGLSGMKTIAEPNPFVWIIEDPKVSAKEVHETTVASNVDLSDNIFFTDCDVEAEISQPQETVVALEGAYVTEAAQSHQLFSKNSVNNSLLFTSLASSLTSLPIEKFPDLLPVAYSYDTNLDSQFAMPVYSGASTAYSDYRPALARESRQEKDFTDLVDDESYALACAQETSNMKFAPNVDAFNITNTNVPTERDSCLDIDGQDPKPVDKLVESGGAVNVVQSDVWRHDQSDALSDDSSDLFLVGPNHMSYNNMFQTKTRAMMSDDEYSPQESMMVDTSEYAHAAAPGGAGIPLSALEIDKTPQGFSRVPRSFQKGSTVPISLDRHAELGFMMRRNAGFMKIIPPNETKGPRSCIHSQNAMATRRKKGPLVPKKFSAASRKERVTKPSETKPKNTKKPRRVRRVFDYSEAKVNTTEVPCPELRNRLVTREQIIEALGDQFDHSKAELVCAINRRRYVRESLDGLEGLHPNVAYEKNYLFNIAYPYQQEFTRVEMDPTTGALIKETRSALCCYCEDLRFYELKNSCYSQHMSHSHGVYTDNSLAPDPILQGKYSMSKKFTPGRKTTPRPRDHPGVVCPVCLDLIEVCCWSSTREKNPLSNYLRHFKDKHRVEKRKETFFNLKA
ncbi:hypothetical protein OXX59_000510 [Metschnikowia pulcherrima]